MEIVECKNVRLIPNRANSVQVLTSSLPNGCREKDEDISRKLAFLTQKVQELESRLQSQLAVPRCSTEDSTQIYTENYTRNSGQSSSNCSQEESDSSRDKSYLTPEKHGNGCNWNNSTPERNTSVLIIPVGENRSQLERSSFETVKQTLFHKSESISGTRHNTNSNDAENNLQSGSFVNSWNSKTPTVIKPGISTVEDPAQHEQKVTFWETILSDKDDEKPKKCSISLLPKEDCLPLRHCTVHANNKAKNLNKSINMFGKTANDAKNNMAIATEQIPRPHVTEVIRDETSRSNYGYTIRVATQWTKKLDADTGATLSTHEELTIPAQADSVQVHGVKLTTLNTSEGSVNGQNLTSPMSGSCGLSLAKASAELLEVERTSSRDALGNEVNHKTHESHVKKLGTYRRSNRLSDGITTQGGGQVTTEPLNKSTQEAALESKLPQHPNKTTYSPHLNSSSSDRLTNFYLNGGSLDSEDGREMMGKNGQESDSLWEEETEDEKNYSICVTGGGDITLVGSDRFIKRREVSYDSIIQNGIDMQMSSSDTQRAGDKKSTENSHSTVSKRNQTHARGLVEGCVNSTIINSRETYVTRPYYQDWTSSDSEPTTPRQHSGYRINRETRRKVKVTSNEIRTPPKLLITNYNKKKTRDISPSRKTKSSSYTKSKATERPRPKIYDFSIKEKAENKKDASIEQSLRELIDPELIGPMPPVISRVPLSRLDTSPESSGFHESSSLTNEEEGLGSTMDEDIVIVETNPSGLSSKALHPKESPTDSPYSSLTSMNSNVEHDQIVIRTRDPRTNLLQHPLRSGESQWGQRFRGEKVFSNRIPHERSLRNGPAVTYDPLQPFIEKQNRPINRLSPLSHPTGFSSSHNRSHEFLADASRLRVPSPVSSLGTSDFSLSDDVFSECECEHRCQCQTGILSRDDFKEELKSVSHYLLSRRQNTLSCSNYSQGKRVMKYHLDDEEGELNLLGYPSKTNGKIDRKTIPIVVKVILRLRKHFYGNFEHQQLPVKDGNNNARSTKPVNLRENASKRISFSPSAMLLSAVGESSVSEIRDVVEKDKVDVNQPSPSGRTLLHKAASVGDIESIRALLSYGADVNLTDQYGFPPLNSALAQAHYKCAIFLMEQGTDLNLYTKARIHEYYEVEGMSQRNLKYFLNTDV